MHSFSLQCTTPATTTIRRNYNNNNNPDMTPSPPTLSSTTAIAAVVFLLLVFPAATSEAATILQTEQYVWGSFDNSNYFSNFSLVNASINFGALQVTAESRGNVSLANRSGRVFYNKPFKLWDDQTGTLVSFNTSFLVNVFRVDNTTPGEGIAFLIAPSISLPSNSYGGFLGLTNPSTDGSAANKLVAVELDTVKQDYDPDDNQIGLDINGVKSNVTVPLSKLDFEIAPIGTKFYELWVDYDGPRKVINVYMASQPEKDAPVVAKPSKPVLSSGLDLKALVNQKSYFGFAASTGVTYELNCVLRWNFSIEVSPEKGSDGKALTIGLGVGGSSGGSCRGCNFLSY